MRLDKADFTAREDGRRRTIGMRRATAGAGVSSTSAKDCAEVSPAEQISLLVVPPRARRCGISDLKTTSARCDPGSSLHDKRPWSQRAPHGEFRGRGSRPPQPHASCSPAPELNDARIRRQTFRSPTDSRCSCTQTAIVLIELGTPPKGFGDSATRTSIELAADGRLGRRPRAASARIKCAGQSGTAWSHSRQENVSSRVPSEAFDCDGEERSRAQDRLCELGHPNVGTEDRMRSGGEWHRAATC